MRIFVYSYSDPLLDEVPEPEAWGVEVDRIYSDWGQRNELDQLFQDVKTAAPDYLLLHRLDELGENLREIGDCLQRLEHLGIQVIATEQDYQTAKSLDRADLGQLFQTIGDRLQRQKIQRGHAKNRRQCLPPPGKAPYGYKRGQDRYLIDRSPWRIRMAQLMPASWIDRMVRKTLTSHLSGTSSSWRGWR